MNETTKPNYDFYVQYQRGSLLPSSQTPYISIVVTDKSIKHTLNSTLENIEDISLVEEIKKMIEKEIQNIVKYSMIQTKKYMSSNLYKSTSENMLSIICGGVTARLYGRVKDEEVAMFVDNIFDKLKQIIEKR